MPRRTSTWLGAVAAVAALLLVASSAQAATPATDIHSAGPLSDIFIGNELSCQVARAADAAFEFFPSNAAPGDCGTFISVGADGQSAIFGPDFGSHPSTGTTLMPGAPSDYHTFAPVSQSLTGSGTAASPYRLTTVVSASDSTLNLQVTEVDSYVVGNGFYDTEVTIADTGPDAFSGQLIHAADCFLGGSTSGFGALEPSQASPTTAACAVDANNSPAAALEEFAPITPSAEFTEESSGNTPNAGQIWGDVGNHHSFTNTCACATNEDNAIGVSWEISLGIGAQMTWQFRTYIGLGATGGQTFAGNAPATVGGTVATFADPDPTTTSTDYTATVNWGDGTSSAGTISGSGGNFTVTGGHTYGVAGAFPISVSIRYSSGPAGAAAVTDAALISSAPSSVQTGAPSVTSSTGAGFLGSVNPEGLSTTAHFEFGLDRRYVTPGASGPQYDHATPSQSVGSDFTSHSVSASVSGLVPNALYHVRLVATNAAGTTNGPDMTFKTDRGPVPGAPGLGKTFNVSSTGLVLIKVNGVFIPLTELTKIPNGTIINALHGTLTLTTALPAVQHAAIAAKKKPKKAKTKTQKGQFKGAVFKVTQARSGLATLALVEGAKFKGAPSYASCKTKKGKAVTAALSKKTLQLLHGSAHGKFRSKGRYAAATVRGTIWTIADRCDGTLTHAIKDTVTVNDFVRHKTIILRPGHSYLAKKR